MPTREEHIAECIQLFEAEEKRFTTFSKQTMVFFIENKALNLSRLPILHSLKSRVKDKKHLEDKLNRKWDDGIEVTKENLFREITDFGGVRVLHLHLDQFPAIHNEIMSNINTYHEWVLFEKPKAYIWDKEKESIYKDLDIEVHTTDTNYTSIHYVIKQNADSYVTF